MSIMDPNFFRRHLPHPRQLAMFAAVAGAYLFYYFADVYTQIYSLHSVIVFV